MARTFAGFGDQVLLGEAPAVTNPAQRCGGTHVLGCVQRVRANLSPGGQAGGARQVVELLVERPDQAFSAELVELARRRFASLDAARAASSASERRPDMDRTRR